MTNEDYARRIVKVQKRIDRMYPWPSGDWDSNNNEWKRITRRRDRATRRIFELPKRWRKVPR
jgi:hypothetical protein